VDNGGAGAQRWRARVAGEYGDPDGMTKAIWKKKLEVFLEPEPMGHPKGEEVYVPRRQVRLVFWIEGGPRVVGGRANLVINFNDPDLLVLSLQQRKVIRIFRVPYAKLSCVELVHGAAEEDEATPRKASLN